jgi:hypothetical protein
MRMFTANRTGQLNRQGLAEVVMNVRSSWPTTAAGGAVACQLSGHARKKMV